MSRYGHEHDEDTGWPIGTMLLLLAGVLVAGSLAFVYFQRQQRMILMARQQEMVARAAAEQASLLEQQAQMALQVRVVGSTTVDGDAEAASTEPRTPEQLRARITEREAELARLREELARVESTAAALGSPP